MLEKGEHHDQDNKKIVITQNFLNALDYLIESGRLKSNVDFERITGFRQQRISGMRKSLADLQEDPESKTKKYYANTDHLAALYENFNVSPNYLLSGENPIIIEPREKQNGKSTPSESSHCKEVESLQWKEGIEQKINMLNEKYLLLKERLDFYAEKNKEN